ncbi:MAG TPA: aspartate aminotransferase family protein [Clostridiales bacterium]|nr:aspartate aminotransferase family protein [Clostridiales bacterium]
MDIKTVQDMDKKYYFNTFGQRLPVAFERGQGIRLYDGEGNEYLDFVAGIAVNCLGYNHPVLTAALKEQVERVVHTSSLYYTKQQALAAKLIAQNSCGDRVFFCNSGAEANEGAIKLARKYFKEKGVDKYEIITLQNSFHGRTMATLAATGQEKYQLPYTPLPPGFKHVEFNNLAALEKAVSKHTCAIMLEVIQGEGGIFVLDTEYLRGVRKLCDSLDILLILDEVQTGIGRTGKLFGYQHFDIEPDIFTLGKGLGGGVPIGALVAKEKVASAFKPGDHGSTFGGNPLACTAACAVLETLLKPGFLENVQSTGKYFKERLQNLKDQFDFILDIRGLGLMLGLQLKDTIDGKKIVHKCLEQGLLINCAGNNTLRFVPPLIVTKSDVDVLIEKLKNIFMDLKDK